MIIKMAAPWKDPKTGVLYLRQRTPRDLTHLKGREIVLPIGDSNQTVRIGDTVQISLRTKEPRKGKERHALADAALKLVWQQARAEAGPTSPGTPDAEPISMEPSTISWPDANMRFGPTANVVLQEAGVPNSDANHALIVAKVASIMDQAWGGLSPSADRPTSTPSSSPRQKTSSTAEHISTPGSMRASNRTTVAVLFERWRTYHKDKVAESTVRLYSASLTSLASFFGDREIVSITGDDIYTWAEHRRDKDKIKPRVINRNDLVAVSSVFGWATKRQGGKLLSSNPVEGVRLDEPRLNTTREPTFREAEARAILGAALIVEPSKSDPAAARAKRWCPWLAAYSGARIAELTALVVEDFRQEEGVWVMHFRQTKTQEPRAVPLHEHIIAQGFLDVLSELRVGPIFFDPSRHQKTAKSAPSELRAQNIARWVRKVAKLDPEVDPNHGWRHTFKSRALGKMEQRVSDAITGHGPGSVARRYETPTVAQMAEALANFPRYEVSATAIDRDRDNSE